MSALMCNGYRCDFITSSGLLNSTLSSDHLLERSILALGICWNNLHYYHVFLFPSQILLVKLSPCQQNEPPKWPPDHHQILFQSSQSKDHPHFQFWILSLIWFWRRMSSWWQPRIGLGLEIFQGYILRIFFLLIPPFLHGWLIYRCLIRLLKAIHWPVHVHSRPHIPFSLPHVIRQWDFMILWFHPSCFLLVWYLNVRSRSLTHVMNPQVIYYIRRGYTSYHLNSLWFLIDRNHYFDLLFRTYRWLHYIWS